MAIIDYFTKRNLVLLGAAVGIAALVAYKSIDPPVETLEALPTMINYDTGELSTTVIMANIRKCDFLPKNHNPSEYVRRLNEKLSEILPPEDYGISGDIFERPIIMGEDGIARRHPASGFYKFVVELKGDIDVDENDFDIIVNRVVDKICEKLSKKPSTGMYDGNNDLEKQMGPLKLNYGSVARA